MLSHAVYNSYMNFDASMYSTQISWSCSEMNYYILKALLCNNLHGEEFVVVMQMDHCNVQCLHYLVNILGVVPTYNTVTWLMQCLNHHSAWEAFHNSASCCIECSIDNGYKM